MYKKILATFIAGCLFFCFANARTSNELTSSPKTSDEWRFAVTPYLWSPGITSTLLFNDKYLHTSALSSSNVLGNLKSGGMIAAEAHYSNWGIMGDLVSATLQSTGTSSVTLPTSQGAVPAKLATSTTLQQTILTGATTYTVLNNKDAYIDGLLGVRSIAAIATLGLVLQSTSLHASDSKSISTVHPIAGFKGRHRIADSTWYAPFYADIGGGGGTTNLTWQAMLGVGKTIEKCIDVSLSYRTLYYDMTGSGLLQKTTFKGPQLAATFNS